MLKAILKNPKKQKTDNQSPRKNGDSKAMQTKSHKEAYTYTLNKKRKRKNIYIYFKKKEESNKINEQIYQ